MDILRQYQLEITLAIGLLVVIEFFILMGVRARMTRLSRMLRNLFAGPEGIDLEAMLKRCQEQSEAAMVRSDELETRYDGFGDVSGQQSFSLVMLDANKNGAVVTGLFSRAASRCYGKAIIAGSPEQSLTDEEQEALELALSDNTIANTENETPGGKRWFQRRQPASV
jgi:hypothetical protein